MISKARYNCMQHSAKQGYRVKGVKGKGKLIEYPARCIVLKFHQYYMVCTCIDICMVSCQCTLASLADCLLQKLECHLTCMQDYCYCSCKFNALSYTHESAEQDVYCYCSYKKFNALSYTHEYQCAEQDVYCYCS